MVCSPTPVTPSPTGSRRASLSRCSNQARASRNQDERLELYGRVDRLLVAEWVVLMPVAYLRMALLRRPWVHGLWANALTPFRLDGVSIERDARPQGVAG